MPRPTRSTPRTAAPVWDPAQYLRHAGHRTRPLADLLARVPRLPSRGRPPRIADLGCGAGNGIPLLAARWPGAHITGLDNSPDMLRRARADHAGPAPGGGRADFAEADARTWAPSPDDPYDLIVSNATLQWVPGHTESFPAWLAGLAPGGVLAFQVPGNFDAPTHTLLRELAGRPAWRDRLAGVLRHGDIVPEPAGYLDRLLAFGCTGTDVWETTYLHVLTGEDPVLDWVKGTALRPVLTALADDPAATDAFLAEYRSLLRSAYPPAAYGTVLPFRRIFAVAVKPGGDGEGADRTGDTDGTQDGTQDGTGKGTR